MVAALNQEKRLAELRNIINEQKLEYCKLAHDKQEIEKVARKQA